MKYHLRRTERAITEASALEDVILTGKYATLAFCRNNEPYLATLNYGYEKAGRVLYFHCAKEGLKTAFFRDNPVVCATIVHDKGYLQNECGHAYRSVIIRGTLEEVTDEQAKRSALLAMIDHLEDEPDIMREKFPNMMAQFQNVQIWRLSVDDITGKEGQ